VDAALTELYASDAAAREIADVGLEGVENRMDARFQKAANRMVQTSAVTSVIQGIAENTSEQYNQTVQSRADHAQVAANHQSRKMRAGVVFLAQNMHELELPEYKQAAEAQLDGFERANAGVEALASLTPAGVPLFAYEVIYGKNLVGRDLSAWERVFAGVEVAAWAAPPVLGAASEFAGSLRHADDVLRYADDAAAAGRALEAASDVVPRRGPALVNSPQYQAGWQRIFGGGGAAAPARRLGRAPEFPAGRLHEDVVLDRAIDYLGPGYRELSPGRYVSADGLRQFRYGAHEVRNATNHHAHFEALDQLGRVIENSVVEIFR